MIALIIGLALLGLLFPFTRVARKHWPQVASIIWGHRFKIILAVLLLIGLFERNVLYGAIWLTIIWAVLRFIQWRRRRRSGWYMPPVVQDGFGSGKRHDAVNDGDFDAVIAAGVESTWKHHAHAVGLSVRQGEQSQGMQDLAHKARRPSDGLGGLLDIREYNKTKKLIQQRPDQVVDADGIYQVPALLGAERSPIGPRFFVSVLPGASMRTYENAAESLAVGLGVIGIGFSQDGLQRSQGVIQMDVRVRDGLAGTRASLDQGNNGLTPVVIGRTRDGDLALDLRRGSHLAIQGGTGSGKSALSYGLLSSLADRPEMVIAGVDPSRLLLGPWTKRTDARQEWLCATSDPEAAVNVLRSLVTEMDRRLDYLVDAGIDEIQPTSDHPLIVVVMEEFAGLVRATKDYDKTVKPAERIAGDIERLMGRLVAESRKVGMRVMAITQRFDADLMGGGARSQFSTRITLKVESSDDVKMLHPGATTEDIEDAVQFPAGRGLVQIGGELMRAQMDLTTYEQYRQRVMRPGASRATGTESTAKTKTETTEEAA
jgi:hypothetical protein